MNIFVFWLVLEALVLKSDGFIIGLPVPVPGFGIGLGSLCSTEYRSYKCHYHGDFKCVTCTCHAGWTGAYCDEKVSSHQGYGLFCPPHTDAPSCNHHGDEQCGTCYCHIGWTGLHCEYKGLCQTWYDSPICTGHGDQVCYTCHCHRGWTGHKCDNHVSTMQPTSPQPSSLTTVKKMNAANMTTAPLPSTTAIKFPTKPTSPQPSSLTTAKQLTAANMTTAPLPSTTALNIPTKPSSQSASATPPTTTSSSAATAITTASASAAAAAATKTSSPAAAAAATTTAAAAAVASAVATKTSSPAATTTTAASPAATATTTATITTSKPTPFKKTDTTTTTTRQQSTAAPHPSTGVPVKMSTPASSTSAFTTAITPKKEKQYICQTMSVIIDLANNVTSSHAMAARCQSGDPTGSEAFLLNHCDVQSPTSWVKGKDVLSNCDSLRMYTPIATFSSGRFYPTADTSGVFLGCSGDEIKVGLQTCTGGSRIEHLTKSGTGYRDASLYYTIQ